ncbi:thiamine phosphate synthase [Nitrincola alkalisediminis]|uniref:thiamine phosphate synthase n=1 Tax=Nitrincola alkalisediminis TaxID=1366656 RepID=UPI001875BD3F|nr:thiamine phosphate synthase [Nitrincola alkalisediminis]
MTSLPIFYPLLDSVEGVELAARLDVRFAQLRIKSGGHETIRDRIRQSLAIAREANMMLVINDHWQLAIEEGADWVHLGQEDLIQADVNALRRAGISLGISTHSQEELERALLLNPDYIALGPIYPTQTKSLTWSAQGLERISEWKAQLGQIPLCVIGGITLERSSAVLASGADIIAVVSDVSLHPDPAERIREWLSSYG